MSNTDEKKIKVFKNPDRSKTAHYKPYVPQYQLHGVEPNMYHGAVLPSNVKVAGPTATASDNPRTKKVALRQPYAVTTNSPVGRGRGPVPNVGNNMEHTWSSVDSEIVDDLSGQEFDPNQTMIDNNDFVTEQAMGFQSGLTATNIQPAYQGFPPQSLEQEVQALHQPADPNDLVPILTSLEDNIYLLIVSGVPVCSGPKEEIEDQARALVFGEHEMCDGNPVPSEDIVVLKRVKVKVGLFLE